MSQQAGRGRKKAQLRSDRTFPTRNSPPDETGWDSASRKMCVCVLFVCLFVIPLNYRNVCEYNEEVPHGRKTKRGTLFHLAAM